MDRLEAVLPLAEGTESPERDGRRLFDSLKQPRAIVGIALVSFVAALAILAPLVTGYPPDLVATGSRLHAPDIAKHLLGTDEVGRDVFSRIVFGARTSLLVAGTAVLLSALIGVTAGLWAGYSRGRADAILMRVVDVQLAFPTVLLAIFLASIVERSVPLVIGLLVAAGWATQARVVRAQVLALRELEFVQAARAIGCSRFRIIRLHLLPSTLPVVTVIGTIQLAQFILIESSLSYLGIGIPSSVPSWGQIVNGGSTYVATAWWISVFPGLAIVTTVTGIGLLGDWLRDYQDVRLREAG